MRFARFLIIPFSLTFLISCSENKNPETAATEPSENATESSAKTADPKVIEAEQYSLAPGKAGQIRVNMLSNSLKKIVPAGNLKTTQRELEGEKYTAYEIRNAKAGDQLLMLAEENCAEKSCKIFRVRILSPKFKTKEGIRVGSTFGEVQKNYPLSFIGLGEADFVALSETQKMAFALDISKFPPKPLYRIKAEDIPAETPVTSILLF